MSYEGVFNDYGSIWVTLNFKRLTNPGQSIDNKNYDIIIKILSVKSFLVLYTLRRTTRTLIVD